MSEKQSDHSKSSNMPAGRFGPMGGNPNRVMQGGEKARDFKATMKTLAGYLKPYWWKIIVVLVFAIASTVFTILGPKLLGKMTNSVVDSYVQRTAYDKFTAQLPAGYQVPAGTTAGAFISHLPAAQQAQIPSEVLSKVKDLDLSQRPNYDYDYLMTIVRVLLVLYILSLIFGYIQGWVMTGIAQEVSYEFRRNISQKINRLPLSYFDKQTYGEVISRVTNDVDTMSQTLNQSLSQMVTSLTMIVGILIMMLSISWLMTLVALVTLPLSFVLIGFIVRKSQRYFREQQDVLGHLNGHIEEMYGGHQVMKVYNGEQASVSKFMKLNDELYGSGWKSQFLSGLMMPLMGFIGNLNFVGVSVLGGWLAVKGTVNIGDIQAFIQYANQFNQPVAQTANIANILQSTAAAAERVFEFLAEEEQQPDPTNAAVLKRVQGAVDFNQVVFGYDQDKAVIKNFSAQIKPGQRVALVGPTGAGKTTIVNLLMRFYELDGGSIMVDGADIGRLKRHDLRSQFGMVLQDSWLFSGTIRANIMYAKPNATKAEFERAVKAAHVEDFVHALPHGYDMVINEEANNLSQGQKQLITIARAMLANPPMLILDEATSSVDTRTELLIQRAMERLMKGKTSFVIAHRLSTIRDADLILVLEEGNIVEQGTHDQLLKRRSGHYAKLYNSQFADFDKAA